MDDDTKGMIGCLASVVVISAVIAAIVYLPGMTKGSSSAPDAAKAERSVPLTRAGPVAEKQVVEKAAQVDPKARKIKTDEETPPESETPPPAKAVIASVQGLTMPAPPVLPAPANRAVEQALAHETLCYRGKPARQVRSLFNAPGYAITFGADDFSGGDPYPRLEVFYDLTRTPPEVTVLSMTHKDIPEFPRDHEVPVPYSAEAISAVLARWMAAVATDTCPAPSPAPAPAAPAAPSGKP